MTLDTREDIQEQEAIQNLFSGSVPERENELSQLISDLQIVFQMLPDEHPDGRVIMDAGLYKFVRFNHRVVRSFWIGAFAAWEGYRAIAESDDISAANIGRFKELIASFEATIANQQADEYPLPHGIPKPGVLPNKVDDQQGRVVAELAIIALGWAFLHEIRHIRHQREGTSAGKFSTPECKRNEEFSCDEFATKFLLEKMADYSAGCGDDLSLVRRKRELGIYLALFSLTLLSKNKWEESDSHPSVQKRINAVCKIMSHDRDKTAAVIAHAAFHTLLEIWPSAPMILTVLA